MARVSAPPPRPTIALVEDTGVTGETVPITSNAALTISDLADAANQTRTVRVVNTGDGTSTSAAGYVAPTASGTYQIVVTDIDTATGESVTSVFTFTLDIDAPAAPTLQLVTDTSGSSLTTSDGTLVAVGTEAGATVEYSILGGPGATGTWSGTLPEFTADGRYTIVVRQTDAAGNVSEVSERFVFTLDTTPPAKPTVVLAFDDNDGVIDLITDKDGFTVTGNVTGDIIEHSLDSGTTWTTTAPDRLANGDYDLVVRLRDVAGNVSAVSDELSFTINKDVPDPPSDLVITNDSGSDTDDGITNEIPTITMTGLPAGSTLQFQIEGTTAWVDELDAADFAVDGSYTIIVRQVAENGSVSTETDEITFTLDTTVEQISATLTNGTTANGVTTVTTTPVFDFEDQETGAAVEFSIDGGTTWQAISRLGTLTAGDYTMQFQQIDVAGNVSTESEELTFRLAVADTSGGGSGGGGGGGSGGGSDGPGGLSGCDFGWC